jgi:hypothetical protein
MSTTFRTNCRHCAGPTTRDTPAGTCDFCRVQISATITRRVAAQSALVVLLAS